MADVLIAYDTIITAADGSRWTPRACGRRGDDGLWEGWIEFLSMDPSTPPTRSPRETEQPNRADLEYWAGGLTDVYLEGALARALRPARPQLEREVSARPHFDAPAPRQALPPEVVRPRPVLNPFDVYRQGQGILEQELSALDVHRLRDIVVGYAFAAPTHASQAERGELTSIIMTQVRSVLNPRPAANASESSPDIQATP